MGEKLYNAIIALFQRADFTFHADGNESVLSLNFSGVNGEWSCMAQARGEQGQFIFLSRCPLKAPMASRQSIAELICRINFGLIVGGFQMDFDDGEILFKTSIDVSGSHLEVEDLINLFKPVVFINLMMMDAFLPVVSSVLCGTSPEEACNLMFRHSESSSSNDRHVIGPLQIPIFLN